MDETENILNILPTMKKQRALRLSAVPTDFKGII